MEISAFFEHEVEEKCHVLFLTLRLEQVNSLHALKHEIHLCWRGEFDDTVFVNFMNIRLTSK